MDTLAKTLYPGDNEETYAIIDGASCEGLLDKLAELAPEHFCLYSGEMEDDVLEVAPYLVWLPPDHSFTDWLLKDGMGRHWGIFARGPADLRELRRHFRKFLMVQGPDGKSLYFRYYDPRVFNAYLPTTNQTERETLFGPINHYLAETDDGINLIRWEREETVGKLIAITSPPKRIK